MEVAIAADAISLERDGERVYFCSEGCRERYGAPR
jgi:YHS domain-containing protein